MKNSKVEAMKALMRNPSTKKMFRDAVKSPIGSTSRSKAQKAFRIMNKLQTAYDGSGGPGIAIQHYPSFGSVSPNPAVPARNNDQAQGMVIFHKIPDISLKYTSDGSSSQASKYKPHAGSFDGTGGPGDYTGALAQTNPFLSFGTTQPVGTSSNFDPGKFFGSLGSGLTDSLFGGPMQNSTAPFKGGGTTEPADVGSFAISHSPIGWSDNAVTGASEYTPPANPNSHVPDNNAVAYTFNGVSYNAAGDPVSGSPAAPTPSNTSSTPSTNGNSTYTPSNGSGASASFGVNKGYDGSILSGTNVDPTASLASVLADPSKTQALFTAMAHAEGGSSAAGTKFNNPLDLMYVGQAGASDSGFTPPGATSTLASFSTPQDAIAAYKAQLSNPLYAGLTVDQALQKWSGAGTALANSGSTPASAAPSPSNVGTSFGAVKAAVAANEGPQTFALSNMLDPNNPVTGGKTEQQTEQANQKTLWDKYNIGGLQDQINTLKNTGANLPTSITAYITGRDQYLNQTDSMINDYITKNANNSDPTARANINAHLNYLYTLRGMQNKSYIDFLNTAVQQNTNEVANVTNEYSTALNSYQTELASENGVTKDMYTSYQAAFADMYSTVDGAPAKAQQASYLSAQILLAQAQAAADGAKSTSQNDYLTDSSKLNGHITDAQGYVLPGIDLVNTINQFQVLQPGMQYSSIVQKYDDGVNTVLGADTSTAKDQEGMPITGATKIKTAQNAITQFANLANTGISATNPDGTPAPNINTYQLGVSYATDVAKRMAAILGGSLTASAPKIVNAIQSLDPHAGIFSWFPSTPSEADFVNAFSSQITDANAAAIATAIYEQFKAYTSGGKNASGASAGGTAASFVQAMLYNLVNTTGRTTPTAYTPDQVAQNVAQIYAQSLLTTALGTPSGEVGSTVQQ